ncbi:hypothetical protein QN277_000470 [Acacia crassicarpa]|uniref:Uncharacterized protein n=1 Tax=Acacia crassicarpa TaxID=499986 RepID=A0AAE1N590_9FABA|nr:hypothetical protein QN277_000470 [Acacia crassicarpa]
MEKPPSLIFPASLDRFSRNLLVSSRFSNLKHSDFTKCRLTTNAPKLKIRSIRAQASGSTTYSPQCLGKPMLQCK